MKALSPLSIAGVVFHSFPKSKTWLSADGGIVATEDVDGWAVMVNDPTLKDGSNGLRLWNRTLVTKAETVIAGLTAAIPLHSNLGAVPRVADSLKRDRFFLLPISHAPGQVGRHGQLIGLMDGQWLDFDGTQIVHRVSRVRAEWEVKIQRAAGGRSLLPNPWMD